MATLDTYDGHEWLPGNNSILGASDDAFLRLDSRVDDDVQGRQIRARISVTKAYASAWMPMVGALQSLRMVFADPRGQRSEMRATTSPPRQRSCRPGSVGETPTRSMPSWLPTTSTSLCRAGSGRANGA